MSRILLAAFITSGATSLILQVVWVRKLREVFGASSLAIATVLATFMAGLALGSWLGGRVADRLRPPPAGASRLRIALSTPIFYYALAEALVAVVALSIPTLVGHFRGVNAWLWSNLGHQPALLAAARFLLTGAVLIIPTTAMGATLPLLGRQITRGGDDFAKLGRRLGWLYAANTAGAVLGAGIAGFWLLRAVGANTANTIAAAGAMTLAVSIFIATMMRGKHWVAAPIGSTKSEDEAPGAPALPTSTRRAVLCAYAFSGGLAMVLEVLWSRALSVVIGSSVYSFTLVLVVFLLGIAGGSAAVARPAERTRDPVGLLSWMLLAIGVGVTFSLFIIDELPAVLLSMSDGSAAPPSSLLAVHTVLSGLAILPSALFLGAVMPLAMRAYVGSVDAVGRDVGRAYAANTVGAIVGALAGGFAVLPIIGLEAGVRTVAVAYAVLAIALAVASRNSRRVVATCTLAIVAALVTPAWNKSDFTAGLFRRHLADLYRKHGDMVERDVVYYRDGRATTVSVERRGDRFSMKNNGKTEASTHTDMPTQILVGLLPVLAHPSGDVDVFVVGYGSGVTVGAITQSPRVNSVDVVEIEPYVYEAADLFFGPFNNRPHNDPKVTRHVGDGRNVLLAGGRRYNVIVSEPSNPWIAGVASLFTRDFYEFAQSHLTDDGVFCQWAQLYELSPGNVKMIYKTFASVFPYVYAFTPGDYTGDTILLGSNKPLPFGHQALHRQMLDPKLSRELARANITSAYELLASLFLGPAEIAKFTEGARINTDDNSLLEYAAPLDLLDARHESMVHLIRNDSWPHGRITGVTTADKIPDPAALARALIDYGRFAEAERWLARAAQSKDANRVRTLHDLARPKDISDPEVSITAGGTTLAVPTGALFDSPEADHLLAVLLQGYTHLAVGEWKDAWAALRDLDHFADTDDARDVRLLVAYTAYKALYFKRARGLFSTLGSRPDFAARRPAVHYYLGRSHIALGRFRTGNRHLETYLDARAAANASQGKGRNKPDIHDESSPH